MYILYTVYYDHMHIHVLHPYHIPSTSAEVFLLVSSSTCVLRLITAPLSTGATGATEAEEFLLVDVSII